MGRIPGPEYPPLPRKNTGRPGVEIEVDPENRVDRRYPVRAARFRGLRDGADIGDVRRDLDEHGAIGQALS